MEASEKRIATISITVGDRTAANRVNDILGKHGDVIIGRLGIPYHEKHVSIIVIVVDSDTSSIGSLGGSLGNIPGVSVRSTMLS